MSAPVTPRGDACARATPHYLVNVSPPTPNGGLHVGHMAGPFLGADMFVKALRSRGLPAHLLSYSDSNQSYVRVTAEQQGADPHDLASRWTRDILETLRLYACEPDDYFEPDAASNAFVRSLFLDLYDRGVLRKKAFPFFYSPSRGGFLDEAAVGGFCPVCLDGCKCGICESCGMLVSAATLLWPRDANAPDRALEIREIPVMVLELEAWRETIRAFHADNPRLRPRYRWLVEDALADPLPDFPVSVPGDWGIPVDHPDFPDQVINAWPEIMGDFVYGFRRAPTPSDVPVRVVTFFGYDNSYFYAIVHVALLHALGFERFLPYATVVNEFYNLDHAKFSTSRGHVVWAHDLAREYPADLVRLYTALTSPGFEPGNFNENDMRRVVQDRLATPWRQVAAAIGALRAETDRTSLEAAAPSATARRAAAALRERVRHSLTLERFNVRQAAEDALRALDLVRHVLEPGEPAADAPGRLADARLLLDAWAEALEPLTPTLADALARQLTAADHGHPPDPDLFRLLQREPAEA